MGLGGRAGWAFVYLSRAFALCCHIVDHVGTLSVPGRITISADCEAESVRPSVDILTFDSKASRVGLSPVRSEDVVEGSRMWGTFVSSEKKHGIGRRDGGSKHVGGGGGMRSP